MLAVLKETRDLLTEKYCSFAFAMDGDGEEIDPRAVGACKFCVIGALSRVTGRPKEYYYNDSGDPISEYLRDVAKDVCGTRSIAQINDTDRDGILKVLSVAIERLENAQNC